MSHLVVTPRDELRRALEEARKEARTGGSLVVTGALFLAISFVLERSTALSLALLILLGTGSVLVGAVKLVHGLRERSSIRAQLRAQELPAARLLDS